VLREEKEISLRSEEVLQFMGLSLKADQPASGLPYGDQKRLEIARTLAMKPRLLLLDEPVAGLNLQETEEMSRTILKIRDTGITVILVEHDMNLVMGISDTITVLNYGKKIAEGNPEEIQKNPEVIKAYLGEEF
jgi:branched-chain amino acid transport system ATP-binding protein